MKLRLVIFLNLTIFTMLVNAANVDVTTYYGKTGGIVGILNSTSQVVNGRTICPANPTIGCDFADDPGFNNNGTVEDSSDDSYNGDLIIRTNDSFQAVAGWTWNGEPGGTKEKVTIRGTLPSTGILPDGSTGTTQSYKWDTLPGGCDLTESSISADQQTMVCVRKDFDKNDVGTYSEDLPFNVIVKGETLSGTQPGDVTFEISAEDAVTRSDDTDGFSLTVTAAPRWNLQKSMYTYYTNFEHEGVKGFLMDYKFYIEVDEVNGEIDNASALVGNESMGESATFNFVDDMSELSPNAKLVDCSMEGRYKERDGYVGSTDPLTYSGTGSIYGTSYPERKIPQLRGEQQITCNQVGTNINVQVDNVDATLTNYPKLDYRGYALPVNRGIAAIGSIYVFVPLDDVKNGADGIADTADDGELLTKNHLVGFDPVTPTGNPNFAGDRESEVDNHYNYTLYYTRGSFDKYYRGEPTGIYTYPGGAVGYRSGDGMATQGYEFSTTLTMSNTGGISFTEETVCDVVDAYRLEIQDIEDNQYYNIIKTYWGDAYHVNTRPIMYRISDNSDTTDAYGNGKSEAEEPYVFEYASTYEDDSWLPSRGGDQDVTHTTEILAECNADSSKWFATSDEARNDPNGIGAVTKVRIKLRSGVEHPPGASVGFYLNHKIRATDLKTGQPLEHGDEIVNYAANAFNGSPLTGSDYRPHYFPNPHQGSRGDRIIFTGPKVRIIKDVDKVALSAGDTATFNLRISFTNDTGIQEFGNVKITDLLPKGLKYVEGSVSEPYAEPAIGSCVDVTDINTTNTPCVEGENQVLIWDLGERESNIVLPDINYSTVVGVEVNSGTIRNVAKIEAPTDASPISQRNAEVGMSVTIPASINIVKSTVENPLYPSPRERTTAPQDVKFIMNMRNGKSGDIFDLDVIDILPFYGDGDDKAIKFNNLELKRNTPTNYHGTSLFGSMNLIHHPLSGSLCDVTANGGVKYYYTNADPKTINTAPTVGTANEIGHADSIWCEGDENGPNGCNGLTNTDVTAVRAFGPRMEADAICQLQVNLTVQDNLAGDIYSNSAGASATGITLPVLSNSLSAPIVGSSLGDWIWYDQNGNGIQDSNEQGIEGITVRLLQSDGTPVKNPASPADDYVVVTGVDGKYGFNKLNSGQYIIAFETPTGYLVSPKGMDLAGKDSNTNPLNGRTDVITLGVDSVDATIDAGFYTPMISGNIFNDGNGDGTVNGSAVALADGVPLYVNLLDQNGTLLASQAVNGDGSYAFDGDDGIRANSNYRVVLSRDINSTTASLPTDWNHADGEHIGTDAGLDGSADGMITVNVLEVNIPNINFGINKKPVAMDNNQSLQINPGGTVQVPVPDLNVTDHEDGTPTTITITSVPSNATLYYNGAAVSAGDTFTNFDNTKLTVDPDHGDQTVIFTYTTTDRAGVVSNEATVTMPFHDVMISGTLFDDGNGNGNIDGTAISIADTTPLYVTLVDSGGSAVASKPLAVDGTYSFNNSDGLQPNTTYTVVLTDTHLETTPNLPINWNHADGEMIGLTGTDGDANGIITVSVVETDIPEINFGINKKPTAVDKSEPEQFNPGGTTQVAVPALMVGDNEDGVPTVITITTLPDNAILYYDGVEVVAGNPIINADPSKFTVDPDKGDLTVIFTYTTTDSVGVVSDEATVTLPFIAMRGGLSDTVWFDDNRNGIQDSNEKGVGSVKVTLYQNDCSTVISETATDQYGKYLFDRLEAGEYCVGVSDLPIGYQITLADQGGDDAKDSDVDPTTGKTTVITLGDGEHNLSLDIGIYHSQKGVIGDTVWFDDNQDGIQDSNENGVYGVKVTLYDSTCTSMIAETVTDKSGTYTFRELVADEYCVGFSDLPAGYQISSAHNGQVSGITLGEGDINLTIDMGIYNDKVGVIGDTVWFDKNQDGIQDTDEKGVYGVKVTLYDSTCTNTLQETATDEAGTYSFRDLVAGDYCVGFSDLPAGYQISSAHNGEVSGITLSEGEINLDIDMGIYNDTLEILGSIGDSVWFDDNRDGMRESGETGVDGVKVTLYLSDCSTVLSEAVTDTDGTYLFERLNPGDYCLGFSDLPAGYQMTQPDQGGEDTTDSDVNPTTGKTMTITLSDGENDLTWDMGIYNDQTGMIGDTVWFDTNQDGIQDSGEKGAEGVQVTLYESDCSTPILATITDQSGSYTFRDLVAGNYCIGFSNLPIGYEISSAHNGQISGITLSEGEIDLTIDMGIYHNDKLGSLGSTVWYDDNQNGIKESTERGVEAVKVTLYQGDCRTKIRDTLTDKVGSYLFEALPAGSYCIGFEDMPVGYAVSPQDQGGNEALDSDVNINTKLTDPITLAEGENNLDIDMGIYTTTRGTIGDAVWYDDNQDGIQDSTERGVLGIKVTLYQNDCSTVVSETVTDEAGIYAFRGLTEQDYCIGFSDLPAGYQISSAHNGQVSGITLIAGEINLSVDMGIYTTTLGSIGNQVWYDDNRDGIQDSDEKGVEAVKVILYQSDCSTQLQETLTDTEGFYQFRGLTSGSYCIGFEDIPVGYQVSPQNQGGDDNQDSDANPSTLKSGIITVTEGEVDESVDMGIYTTTLGGIGNSIWYDSDKDGIQDSTESGVEAVKVTFYQADCSTPISETMTDQNGIYSFRGLPQGDYCIGVSDLPPSYRVSPKDAGGDDTKDSDIDPTTKRTGTIHITEGVIDINWDIGLFHNDLASVGSHVWYDENRNGLQEPTESGVEAVKVTLYEDDCATPIRTTVTDNRGIYQFRDLNPAVYCLGFSDIPVGYQITLPDQGTDDQLDSDVNPDSYLTSPFTLLAGENNTILDMGIYNEELGSIGSHVWYDENRNGLQESNEKGVEAVHVQLYNDQDTLIAETATDSRGVYRFYGLVPGNYYLVFDDIPVGYSITTQDAGDDTRDSDANTTTGRTVVTHLENGEHDLSWAMGIYNQKRVTIGDAIWYDDNQNGIQDEFEYGVDAVKVTLYTAAGTKVGSTLSDSEGNYQFSNLLVGEYYLEFSDLPISYQFTEQDVGDDDTDSDVDPSTKRTPLITVGEGKYASNWDAGIVNYKEASIGDAVWYDDNHNGIKDPYEIGVADVLIRLYDENHQQIDTTLTDKRGNFAFRNLTPGAYYLEFSHLPVGYEITSKDKTDEQRDSDVDPTTGQTELTILEVGENDLSWDLGIYNRHKATLGDSVWYDADHNGIQDANETGVNGVKVTLYDRHQNIVATTITDAQGKYLFRELIPGEYYLRFSEFPVGYMITKQNQAEDTLKDSDANYHFGETTLTTLEAGESDLSWDVGIYIPTLFNIGDYVWDDLNRDGIQDANESGIEGVKVTLIKNEIVQDAEHQITTPTQPVYTDANGHYLFENIEAYEPHQYRIVFDHTTLPNEYRFTEQDQGEDDAKDSDVNATGSIPLFILTHTDLNFDAGARSTLAVAGEIIKSEEACDECEPYTESVISEAKDSVPVHSIVWLLILFGTSLVSGMFFRKELSCINSQE